jgi:hypothetical protein
VSNGRVFVGIGVEFLCMSLECFLSESTVVRQSPSLVLIIQCIEVESERARNTGAISETVCGLC